MILVLGGTSEARALAEILQRRGLRFVSTLAGRVARPRMPVGAVLVGGFGGVTGLRGFLAEHRVTAVVDATHPFAEGMTRNAVLACEADRVPMLRLERPGWAGAPGADVWHWVDDHETAALVAASLGERPFLTVGRQRLDRFVAPLSTHAVVARVVDPPDVIVPDGWTIITSRGPYDLDGELMIIDEHRLDVLVTKDSGGAYTWAKLEAAAARGLPVVVVRRGSAVASAVTVTDPDVAAAWAAEHV